jgi:endoribonuclease LACTB2
MFHCFHLGVLGHGTAVFDDLRAYITSLHKMQNRVSGRAYPGHGAVIDNAAARVSEYITHRQQREDEILHVLRFGSLDVSNSASMPPQPSSWTPIELVKAIYKDVPESLHIPASHGVVLVLNKLNEEGKVYDDHPDGRWRIASGRHTL